MNNNNKKILENIKILEQFNHNAELIKELDLNLESEISVIINYGNNEQKNSINGFDEKPMLAAALRSVAAAVLRIRVFIMDSDNPSFSKIFTIYSDSDIDIPDKLKNRIKEIEKNINTFLHESSQVSMAKGSMAIGTFPKNSQVESQNNSKKTDWKEISDSSNHTKVTNYEILQIYFYSEYFHNNDTKSNILREQIDFSPQSKATGKLIFISILADILPFIQETYSINQETIQYLKEYFF